MIENKFQDAETTQGGTSEKTCQKEEFTYATENFEAEQSDISSIGIGPMTIHEGTPTVCISPMATWEGIPSVCEGVYTHVVGETPVLQAEGIPTTCAGTLTHAVGGSEATVSVEGRPTKFRGCGHAVGGLD